MSGKRPSLAESMRAVAEAPAAAPQPPKPQTEAAAPKAEMPEGAGTRPKGFYAATRAGKRGDDA